LSGRINTSDIVSSTQITRMTNEIFQYDASLLRADLAPLKSVHLQADISDRKHESRLSLWLTGFNPILKSNVKFNIWSGALSSKTGFDQRNAVISRISCDRPQNNITISRGRELNSWKMSGFTYMEIFYAYRILMNLSGMPPFNM